jgi:hypothetical protein
LSVWSCHAHSEGREGPPLLFPRSFRCHPRRYAPDLANSTSKTTRGDTDKGIVGARLGGLYREACRGSNPCRATCPIIYRGDVTHDLPPLARAEKIPTTRHVCNTWSLLATFIPNFIIKCTVRLFYVCSRVIREKKKTEGRVKPPRILAATSCLFTVCDTLSVLLRTLCTGLQGSLSGLISV